jgi:predicted PurR-regulated permease PerM
MKNSPTPYQIRTLWNAATGVSILILGLLVVGLIWLTGKLFGFLQPVLIPIIVAGIIAYLLDPVVKRVQRFGLSRTKAVITVFTTILITLLLLILAILPGVNRGRAMIKNQIAISTAKFGKSPSNQKPNNVTETEESQIDIQKLASFLYDQQQNSKNYVVGLALASVDKNGEGISHKKLTEIPTSLDFFWETRIGYLLKTYNDEILNLASTGTSKILSLLGLIIGMAMVPIYLFFFLKDSASIQQNWHDYVPLKASRFKNEVVETLREINGYLISFFRGQVLVAFIDGILVGIALTFYGLPYGFLIGIFMALLGVIPYIGNILCLIPACVIGWFYAASSLPFGLDTMSYTIGIIIIFVVVQQINSLVTAPKIVGDSVGLHPMTVIFAMIFWTVILGGFVGALLAVPLTASIKVLFRRFVWEKKIKSSTEQEIILSHL